MARIIDTIVIIQPIGISVTIVNTVKVDKFGKFVKSDIIVTHCIILIIGRIGRIGTIGLFATIGIDVIDGIIVTIPTIVTNERIVTTEIGDNFATSARTVPNLKIDATGIIGTIGSQ